MVRMCGCGCDDGIFGGWLYAGRAVHEAVVVVVAQCGDIPSCRTLYDNQLSGSIPESVGNLSCLATLDLRQCAGLVELPKTLSSVLSLRDLPLDGCDEIVALPDLSHIKELRVGRLPARLASWESGGRAAFDFRRTGRRRVVM